MDEIHIKKVYADHGYMYLARIELTTKCNFRCKHCFIEDYGKNGLKTEEVFALLDNLRKVGVYVVEFTGGEIFTRPDIMDIIRYARKLKFSVSILSNLSLITDDIVKELSSLSIDGVSTTLFSMSDQINDKITGSKKSATKIIDNILKIVKAGISVEVKTVVMRDNVEEYQAIQEFCSQNGIDYLATEGLFPAMSGDEAPRRLRMTYEQLRDNICALDKIRFEKLYKKVKQDDTPICCELFYSMFIGADGECYPCNLWFKKLGNIRDYNYDISSIWNAPFLTEVRKLTWKDLKKCSQCENSAYCIRCTGIVDAVKGDLFLEDPYACRTAYARKEAENNLETSITRKQF